LLLRGVVAVLFGILAFSWPGLTLVTLVIFYGAYALVDGIVALAAAFGGGETTPRWWLAIVGIAGIAAGSDYFLLARNHGARADHADRRLDTGAWHNGNHRRNKTAQ
jgi:uncharacterized membrane protein HdeD (DUF308 family)